ncbi:MAG: PLP-dependent lyase/thiolase [Acidimicrobiales bacterium]
MNPYLKYRTRLDSYRYALDNGLSDAWFVEQVQKLDAAVAGVEGHGFEETPIVDGSPVARAAGLDVELFIKAEPHNVGGSHKARHLFGVALHQLTQEALGAEPQENLAIASCGNAALGAAVIAAAMKRNLEVFVPVWADESVITRLDELGASINRCERRPGESGDPCYHRFTEAVEGGAGPFSVQGTDTPTTFDGGRTLGWELADQVPDLDAIYVQVGGGALATAVSMALPDVRLHPVQAEGAAPLRRAWEAMSPDFDFDKAEAHPDEYMTPWENPTSLATGILDDITYDWIPLLKQTRATGGEPIVAPEDLIVTAYEMAHRYTDVPVCVTGTAGLAGLLHRPPDRRERVAVLFTGLDRQ